ncbi:MAG: phosphatidylinositol-3-phosphatase [Gaiellaceae bacterium]|nr:phosphatidylinositol-3-phosphatase [Gaiellaceae bacterium]
MRSTVPRLDHVVVVVFENKERESVLGSGAAPTFDRLAAAYAQATNDRAVSHPSLPNYLALVSGSTHGVRNDCENCPQSGPTVGSLLTQRGRSWGSYAEGYPAGPRFAKKHVPFLYFAGGAAHVHPLSAFDASRLPAYSFVTPDLCHDMHDCPIATGDAWLARFVKPLLSVKRTAIFIVFDEGSSSLGGGGAVALVVAGTAVKPHTRYTLATSHYGLLRTVEAALGLPAIGEASGAARPLTGIWR